MRGWGRVQDQDMGWTRSDALEDPLLCCLLLDEGARKRLEVVREGDAGDAELGGLREPS